MNTTLHHVKFHGALYNMVAKDENGLEFHHLNCNIDYMGSSRLIINHNHAEFY
ncbi:MAG: LamB/YcsF family protein [Cyclobacteriaceae bacterium]|nr:LamB/YcsF family protein [Cyclobacteriaceae bacterium]